RLPSARVPPSGRVVLLTHAGVSVLARSCEPALPQRLAAPQFGALSGLAGELDAGGPPEAPGLLDAIPLGVVVREHVVGAALVDIERNPCTDVVLVGVEDLVLRPDLLSFARIPDLRQNDRRGGILDLGFVDARANPFDGASGQVT